MLRGVLEAFYIVLIILFNNPNEIEQVKLVYIMYTTNKGEITVFCYADSIFAKNKDGL